MEGISSDSDSIDDFNERSQGQRPLSCKAVRTTLSDSGGLGTEMSAEDVSDGEGVDMSAEEVSDGEDKEIGLEEVIMSKTLPEELVEKIIALMPYPSIFKARLLSRSWFAKFKPISALHTEEEKHLAILFQKRVTGSSMNWDTFCTLASNVGDPIIVYSQARQKWQALPSLSFLPDHVLRPARPARIRFEGAFIYWIQGPHNEERVGVGNILTREWKMLPVRPQEHRRKDIFFMELIIDKFLETFKVILLCEFGWQIRYRFERYVLQVYDSQSKTWRTKRFEMADGLFLGDVGSAYHKGVLYMVSSFNLERLWAFNVEEWTSKEFALTVYCHPSFPTAAKLVSCNDSLVLIATWPQSQFGEVLEVDLELLQVLGLARCPAAANLAVINTIDMFSSTFGGANCTFFKFGECDNRMLEYNKLEDTWKVFYVMDTCDYWNDCNFQPGLNPFMTV